ncbi:acetyl-CoA synthetase-like protein [Tothia fuscella]|uniref:Acetyl-CoA synthetase-like protein n=1 Tax=Tothia fuscella TaxID=1048955 RepID=A0A9P4NFM7_9PEZI|nr:acetyl-CoA synthetase-like protein [Tothia fuscella]
MATEFFTLDHCLRSRAAATPERHLLAYPEVVSGRYVDYSAKGLSLMVQKAALHYRDILPPRSQSEDDTPAIALLGVSSLEYIVTFLALQRLGFATLFLSTRLADNALEHLLVACDCGHVIGQSAFQPAILRIAMRLPKLHVIPFVGAATLQRDISAVYDTAFNIDPQEQVGRLSHIIHSSGSTGLPKPVPVKHGNSIVRSGVQFEDTDFGFTCLPLFHNYGLFTLTFAITSGIKGIFPSAHRPLTGATLLKGLRETKAKMLYCVPVTLKLITEAEGGVEALRGLKQVTLSGASCPEDLGNLVVGAGVNLMNYYGSTETGNIMRRSADEWNWLQLFPVMAKTITFEKSGDENSDIYECVALPDHRLNGSPNREDGCYATKDIFRRHPTDPSKWKYIGRLDDTIVLSNGEKVNPVFIEDSVRLSPYVSEAVVFGAGRPSLGLLVIASEQSVRECLWEKDIVACISKELEIGNKSSPAYARISLEAVIVKKYGTNWPKTDKSSVIRPVFIQKFAPDIAAYYESLEQGTGESTEPRARSREEIENTIRELVMEELKIDDPAAINGSTDFFSLGCDSLGAINIRRYLTQRVETRGERLPNNVVFEHPTIDSMTEFLTRLCCGEQTVEKAPEQELIALLEKYRNFTPGIIPSEYILLTGATGSLGSHILHQLVSLPAVAKVYCLVRASTPASGMERILASQRHACLLEYLKPSHLDKITALTCDLSRADLGLEVAIHDELNSNLTAVIHSAWFVNFNLDVHSFEEMQIKGTHNLLSLCLRSTRDERPSFNFISSISSAFGFPSPDPIPESLPPLQSGVGVPIMGYARSKLVAEHVCEACTRQTGLITRVLRVGQIIGDLRSGIWSQFEAWPLTLQTALSIGALPIAGKVGEEGDADEVCRWLPVDDAAHTVIELSLPSLNADTIPSSALKNGTTPVKQIEVYNIQHPTPLLWKRDVIPVLRQAGLVFEGLPIEEWLQRVESNDDPLTNPAIRLLDFFKAKYRNRRDGRPVTGDELSIDWAESDQHQALAKSKALREVAPVDEKLITRVVEYLMGVWGGEGRLKA